MKIVKIEQDAIDDNKAATEKWQSEKLEYVNSVTTDPQENLNFHTFFQDREGLLVYSNFAGNVLRYVIKIVDKVKSITAYYFDCKEDMSDLEISQELPKGYKFNLIKGLALIVWLLLKQWGGKSGVLLTTGNANIFHLKILDQVLVVGVYRDDAGFGEWYVNGCRFDELGPWYADSRVFSSQPA